MKGYTLIVSTLAVSTQRCGRRSAQLPIIRRFLKFERKPEAEHVTSVYRLAEDAGAYAATRYGHRSQPSAIEPYVQTTHHERQGQKLACYCYNWQTRCISQMNDAYMRIYSPWQTRNIKLPLTSSQSVPSILGIVYEGEVRRVRVPGHVV